MLAVNEGPLDRGFRVVLGGILLWLGLASGILESPISTLAIAVGAIALLTGVTGFCGLYKVFGINTCAKDGGA